MRYGELDECSFKPNIRDLKGIYYNSSKSPVRGKQNKNKHDNNNNTLYTTRENTRNNGL